MKKRFFILGAVFVFFSFVFQEKCFALSNEEIQFFSIRTDASEFIELKNLTGNSLLLTGLSIVYTNSSGNDKLVYQFSEGTEMTGESLLLKPFNESETNADLFYRLGASGMSQTAGKLALKFEEETFDEICWGTFSNCETGKFKETKPILLRGENGFEFVAEYEPDFSEEREVLFVPEIQEETPEPQCRGLIFSEILTYYESSPSEQFIEFFNSSSSQIVLNGCFVRYKNKNFSLEGIVSAESFFTFYPTTPLTKNPTASNKIEIIDTDGETVDSLVYLNGQKKAMSFAQFGYDKNGKEQWLQTYSPTHGTENNYQKFKTCPEGKVINEETGNCVNKTSVSTELEPCPAGSFRNPLTNRCRKYTTTTTSLKECAEGYERNPETNRCRKIVSNDGANFPLETEQFEEKSNFVAIWAITGVLAIGVFYIVFEYRKEIIKFFKKK